MTVTVYSLIREEKFAEVSLLYEKAFRSKLSGNEVYHTNSSILLVKNMLCSRLRYQKGLNRKFFPVSLARIDDRDRLLAHSRGEVCRGLALPCLPNIITNTDYYAQEIS